MHITQNIKHTVKMIDREKKTLSVTPKYSAMFKSIIRMIVEITMIIVFIFMILYFV